MLTSIGQSLSAFLTSPLGQAGLALLLVIGFTLAALALTNWAAREAVKRINVPEGDAERQARLLTIISTARNTLRITILATAALGILASLGIDLTAIFAAAGIAGIAISLGAQTLIKDFFGGIMILFEDQYRVGDHISVGAVSGTVEQITLRRTSLRSADGTLFSVPNGDIRTVGNTTRGWSRASVEFNLGYDADIARAIAVLQNAMASAAQDPELSLLLLEAPEILGWTQTNDWGVSMRLQAKVKPGQQWAVGRQLRHLSLDALRAAGIPIAQPQLLAPAAAQAR